RRERADDALAGDLERAARPGAEVRLAREELVERDLAQVVVPVLARGRRDARQRRELLVVPRDEQRAGPLHRDADPRGVRAEQLEPAAHQARLERAGLRVEAGVQER